MAKSIAELRSASSGSLINPADDKPVDVFGSKGGFETAMRMANAISTTNMVPEAYRKHVLRNNQWEENPAAIGNCLIALELKTRLNMPLLMVMQNVDIIYGRPGLRSQLKIGLLNQSGDYTAIQYEEQNAPEDDSIPDDWRCRAKITERATGVEHLGPWISIRLAKTEGWWDKRGSKWKTIPQKMLRYRAASWLIDQVAPQVGLGLPTTEEVYDTEIIEGEVEPAWKKAQRDSRNAAALAREAMADVRAEEEDEPDDQPTPEEAAPEDAAEPPPEEGDTEGETWPKMSETGDFFDADGVVFDPDLHAVSDKGAPSVTPRGVFRARQGYKHEAKRVRKKVLAGKPPVFEGEPEEKGVDLDIDLGDMDLS